MKALGIVLACVVILLVILVAVFVSKYNKLVRGRTACDEAFATMDVYLKKRYDMIPNLIATVKGSDQHEKQMLEAAMQAAQTTDRGARMAAESNLTVCLSSLMARLSADGTFSNNSTYRSFAEALQKVEEDIANSRKYYNAVVKEYNASLLVLPNNLIAGIGGFRAWPMFEVGSDAERDNVKVSF